MHKLHVEAHRKSDGAAVTIPEHWLKHPRLGKPYCVGEDCSHGKSAEPQTQEPEESVTTEAPPPLPVAAASRPPGSVPVKREGTTPVKEGTKNA